MKIMFEDLTYEARVRLLDEVGISSPVEMSWHILPIAVVEFKKKLPVIGDDNVSQDIYGQDDDY